MSMYINFQRELASLDIELQVHTKMGKRRQERVIYSIFFLWGRNFSTHIIPDTQLSRIFFFFQSFQMKEFTQTFRETDYSAPLCLLFLIMFYLNSSFLEAGRTKVLHASPVSTAEKVVSDIYENHRKNSSPTASNLLCFACCTTLWEHYCGYVSLFGNNYVGISIYMSHCIPTHLICMQNKTAYCQK